MSGATGAQRSRIRFRITSRATGRNSSSINESDTKREDVSNVQRGEMNPLNHGGDGRLLCTHLTPADDFLGVYPRPKLLSLSLNESGVEADNEDRDGRDMAMDLDERSRT